MSAYYIAKDGKQVGIFEEEDVRQQIAAGNFDAADLCWREGMENWQPIESVLNLAAATAAPSLQTEVHVDEPVLTEYVCPHCKQNFKVGEDMRGLEVLCPSCKTGVRVPRKDEKPESGFEKIMGGIGFTLCTLLWLYFSKNGCN